MVKSGASEGQRNEAQAASRRWRIHLVLLLALLLAWAGLAFRAAAIARSSAVKLETIGVVFLGFSGLVYALVTSAAMLALRRRPLAPLFVHGGAAALIGCLSIGGNTMKAHRRAADAESRARSEAAARAETERLERCLRIGPVRLLLGSPLRVELTLHNGDCSALEISSLTFAGQRDRADSLIINHFPEPRLRLQPGASTRLALIDDRDLLSAEGWAFSVDVTIDRPELLSLLYCGPGAESFAPEVKPCRPLAPPVVMPMP